MFRTFMVCMCIICCNNICDFTHPPIYVTVVIDACTKRMFVFIFRLFFCFFVSVIFRYYTRQICDQSATNVVFVFWLFLEFSVFVCLLFPFCVVFVFCHLSLLSATNLRQICDKSRFCFFCQICDKSATNLVFDKYATNLRQIS